MKIFLDANILFSALLPHSRTGNFLALALKRALVATSGYAVEETQRNLARYKPKALDELELLVSRLDLCNDTTVLRSWSSRRRTGRFLRRQSRQNAPTC